MKTKSILISAISVAALTMQLNAQTVEKPINAVQAKSEATVVFDSYNHDFGTLKESDGKASAVFTFTNKGDSALVISKVETSCGCTASEWTREPVAPGKQGHITVTYDPTNRIYAFSKTLTVYSNGSPSRIVLTIKGTASK